MYYERSLIKKQTGLPDIHPDIVQRSLPHGSPITADYENNLQRIQNALNA